MGLKSVAESSTVIMRVGRDKAGSAGLALVVTAELVAMSAATAWAADFVTVAEPGVSASSIAITLGSIVVDFELAAGLVKKPEAMLLTGSDRGRPH